MSVSDSKLNSNSLPTITNSVASDSLQPQWANRRAAAKTCYTDFIRLIITFTVQRHMTKTWKIYVIRRQTNIFQLCCTLLLILLTKMLKLIFQGWGFFFCTILKCQIPPTYRVDQANFKIWTVLWQVFAISFLNHKTICEYHIYCFANIFW